MLFFSCHKVLGLSTKNRKKTVFWFKTASGFSHDRLRSECPERSVKQFRGENSFGLVLKNIPGGPPSGIALENVFYLPPRPQQCSYISTLALLPCGSSFMVHRYVCSVLFSLWFGSKIHHIDYWHLKYFTVCRLYVFYWIVEMQYCLRILSSLNWLWFWNILDN